MAAFAACSIAALPTRAGPCHGARLDGPHSLWVAIDGLFQTNRKTCAISSYTTSSTRLCKGFLHQWLPQATGRAWLPSPMPPFVLKNQNFFHFFFGMISLTTRVDDNTSPVIHINYKSNNKSNMFSSFITRLTMSWRGKRVNFNGQIF